MNRDEVDAFLAECDDVIDDWEGSADSASWAADGSHEFDDGWIDIGYTEAGYAVSFARAMSAPLDRDVLMGTNRAPNPTHVAQAHLYMDAPRRAGRGARLMAQILDEAQVWFSAPPFSDDVWVQVRGAMVPLVEAMAEFSRHLAGLWDDERQEPVFVPPPDTRRRGIDAQRSPYGPQRRH